MKKVLFMLINMNVGGTEKSLLNILEALPKDKYEITVLLLEEYGGYLNEIPQHVKVKYLENYCEIKEALNKPPIEVGKNLIRQGHVIKGFNTILSHILSKILNNRSIYFKYILKNYKTKEQYHTAIAFAGPMDFISYYIINKVKAYNKVQWIHFDIDSIGINTKFCKNIYEKFDYIFAVSEEAKNKLINLIPILKDKTGVLQNIISPNTIHNLADKGETFPDDFEGIRILTVGRVSHEKGQYMTIPVLARLKKDGYNVRWYCIGEGNDLKNCKHIVKKYNLEKDYIFLGVNKNPYTMMKDCDIYVQPSIHEGFCITLSEARCFTSPIVTTNFVNADKHVKDGYTGLIADINEESIYKNIKKILDDSELKNKIENNLFNNNPDTRGEIKKLENIIDKR
ncbi:glycosyltransferase [Intestinibacter bartlettii]|uniref:glycosyltransferase n=1 Tax=Intestinibacter bartlettii TaxID=261299 RepID=UPI0026DBFB55|nr:glycosyltransferase [Intestinibacter bartlettii]